MFPFELPGIWVVENTTDLPKSGRKRKHKPINKKNQTKANQCRQGEMKI